MKHSNECFDLEALRARLSSVVDSLESDLANPKSRTCLSAIAGISESYNELEALDVPPNYIVRLRTEQGLIRKTVLRSLFLLNEFRTGQMTS